ncbi:ribose-phosphate diphosphokinase [Tepidimonas taiwanensis]|uniref:Ribose-phosphate pyrophosphokinase 2 n=1 Tax=Tepidimonas taiwanensis TaxID=307486 RepID=A0A554X530_9BURK|nr:ribose-phosphate diphosphokinase [Tepidimonas taiwanensis]MDM7462120.1 ribose-phosphate diphosphokinase [Tepidimonas taiwanensis]TSE30944.1 Ribose-phosphate pyrophosphokinase 2 [Tepidimonas taiwanensis]UBQ05844.1 ribose-phosphate diphosphokinase [Tepidimonas taiwanensis]
MPLLLCFDDERGPAQRLLAALQVRSTATGNAGDQAWALAPIERHRFPDGELRLRLPPRLPPAVAIYRSLHQPNEKLVELLLAAPAARALGAQRLWLVAPYLAYMRQDMAFTPGEVVSQRHVGHWLAAAFDGLITVDPHLHRVATLAEAVPLPDAHALTAAPLLAQAIAARRPGALLVGPDEESAQWVRQAAAAVGLEAAVCRKVRRGDRDVVIELPPQPVRGRAVVILDDMASTGRTVAQAAIALRAAGAVSVDVAVTHALFIGDALAVMRTAGVGEVWSADSVPHDSNAVPLAPLLAAALHDGVTRSRPVTEVG